MDDFHTCNIMADGSELMGFIDLEMARYGNEVLLLAAAIAMTKDGRPERWGWIRRGYEDSRGEPIDGDLLTLARIAAPFSQWTRFMWYWTGNPQEFEEGARGWPIRDIKAIAERVQETEP
jgi:Ser/Thr protein kinase RdoA (MazF antagonist)